MPMSVLITFCLGHSRLSPPNCYNDGDGYTVSQGDCNDNDPLVFPGANVTLGNVVLLTQQEVDDFVNDCSCVNSITVQNLSIGQQFGFIVPSDITNISGLSKIVSIVQELNIFNNPLLPNINGLSNLTNIGGGIGFEGNDICQILMPYQI